MSIKSSHNLFQSTCFSTVVHSSRGKKKKRNLLPNVDLLEGLENFKEYFVFGSHSDADWILNNRFESLKIK